MAALDNFRINAPNFQNTANELANHAYNEARNRGLSHLDALEAMEKGPMGLNRDLLSVTGTKGEMHGYIPKIIRDAILGDGVGISLPPPVEAAPALLPSHLTGPKMGSAPQPALQTGAPAKPRPPHVNHMQSAIANDPLLQLMAGGDKRRVGPQETLYFYNSLHPDAKKQHASRIDGSHLAKLEMRDAILQEAERMKLINNPLGGTGGALADTSEISNLITKTDNFGLPKKDDLNAFQRNVLNISNALQNTTLGQAMTDPDILTKLTITHNGVEIPNTRGAGLLDKIGAVYTYFTSNGMDESSASSATLEAVHEAANNGGTAQEPSQQSGSYFPEMPVAPPALATPNESGNTDTEAPQTDKGVLTAPVSAKPTQSTVRSTTGGYTGNARGSDLPDMQIGLNERLMRMGAAGLAAGGQGSLAQMGAMFGASADVNQLNRQAEMEAFGIEEERRQAHAARVAALAASKNKGAGGGDMSKLKDFQAKNFGFYNRGVQAEKALLEVGDIGTDLFELLKSNVPLIGNNLVDPKFQRYDQARRNFVNAVLRRESGAVISDAEFENANIQYFPQPFDSAETIAQKQQNRRATMEGIRMGAGPSIFYTSSYPMAGGGSVNIDVGDGETYEVKTAPRKDKQ